jgi:UDP-N-acetylmuramate dehydrogenase
MTIYDNFHRIVSGTGLNISDNQSLAKYTTMKVGGKADIAILSENSNQLKQAILLARECEVPFIILGKGSNVIISDAGYRGLVIINTSKKWKAIQGNEPIPSKEKIPARFNSDESGFNHREISSELTEIERVYIRADSGININYLMHELYKSGITGLQWFAGIPATLGGAIYMNMHGGEYFFGDLVRSATLLDGTTVKKVNNTYFNFDYDWSILHNTGEIILDADLRLTRGNLEAAKKLTEDWARHKANQPRRSAGCIFRNLSEEQREKYNLPSTSIGYLIDKILDLKGEQIGDAIISEKHAAFIENLGKATASDVYGLMQLVKEKARIKLGLELQEEVQLIGRF